MRLLVLRRGGCLPENSASAPAPQDDKEMLKFEESSFFRFTEFHQYSIDKVCGFRFEILEPSFSAIIHIDLS